MLPHAENNFRMRRIVSACGDRCSACGGTSPHAEIRVPRVEDRLRMRRPVFRVRRTLSACGDSCSACGDSCSACGDSYSACGGPSPHAEIGVPRAENLASYVYYTGFTTFTRSEERWSRDLRKVRRRKILFMTFRVAIARSFVSSTCTLILAPLAGNTSVESTKLCLSNRSQRGPLQHSLSCWSTLLFWCS